MRVLGKAIRPIVTLVDHHGLHLPPRPVSTGTVADRVADVEQQRWSLVGFPLFWWPTLALIPLVCVSQRQWGCTVDARGLVQTRHSEAKSQRCSELSSNRTSQTPRHLRITHTSDDSEALLSLIIGHRPPPSNIFVGSGYSGTDRFLRLRPFSTAGTLSRNDFHSTDAPWAFISRHRVAVHCLRAAHFHRPTEGSAN